MSFNPFLNSSSGDFSGDYNDLINKPTIPTVSNDLTDELKEHYDLAYSQSHTHSNMQALMEITDADITALHSTFPHKIYEIEQSLSDYATKEEVTQARVDVIGTLGYVTPEMFGAKGDGVADDTQALKSAILENKKVVLSKVYKLTESLELTNVELIGDNVLKTSILTYADKPLYFKGSNILENITFKRCSTKKEANVRLINNNNTAISNCIFTSDENTDCDAPLDLFSGNKNVNISHCQFLNYGITEGGDGGVWVRDLWGGITQNITFDDCIFESITEYGCDETLAIWGGGIGDIGTVENVLLNNCVFHLKCNDANRLPPHFLTLGMTGTTRRITLSNCYINNESARSTIIKSYGESDAAIIEDILLDNCIIDNNIESSLENGIFRGSNTIVRNSRIYTKKTISICQYTPCELSNVRPILENCIIISDEQMNSSNGTVFKNCDIRLNSEFSGPCSLATNGIDIINTKIRGINATGILMNLFREPDFAVKIENSEISGTITGQYFIINSNESRVLMISNSKILDKESYIPKGNGYFVNNICEGKRIGEYVSPNIKSSGNIFLSSL